MTGQVRRSQVSSTSETACASRHLTLVLIQDEGGSSSTAVLPLCPLTQHLSPDTTSLRTTGKSSSVYSVKQQTGFLTSWENDFSQVPHWCKRRRIKHSFPAQNEGLFATAAARCFPVSPGFKEHSEPLKTCRISNVVLRGCIIMLLWTPFFFF